MPYFYKVKTISNEEQDPNLINPSGLLIKTDNLISKCCYEFWVANNGTGTVSHYNEKGNFLPFTGLIVPPVAPAIVGSPASLVWNDTHHFIITDPVNNISGKSLLLTCSNDGQILGWNSAVNKTSFVSAFISTDNAFYTSLVLANDLLYATDFANNKIDVFDGNFVLQNPVSYPFTDPIPSVYSVIDIKVIDNNLNVAYSLNDGSNVITKGPGFGIVNIFDYNGNFVRRLINSLDNLNAPYGMTFVQPDFSQYSNTTFFVGNYGDGTIQQRNLVSGEIYQYLRYDSGHNIEIENLWELYSFNNKLYFLSSPEDGNGGKLGVIERTCNDCCKCKKKKC